MKINLDYDRKIIGLESNTNLGEFFEKITKILPDYKEWSLNTNTQIVWNNPITIPYIPTYPRPLWEPRYYINGASETLGGIQVGMDNIMAKGDYNIEI